MELRGLGKYRLVAPFAVRSALCRFYLARHEDEPDDVPPSYLAKLLLPGRGEDEPTLRAQFAHEAKLLGILNHHSIPTLHAAGEQDGVAYMVLDYVHGVNLADLLGHFEGEPRGLSKEIAVYIMGQLADAVRHAHELAVSDDAGQPVPLGVLHRDLCPANVLLSVEGDTVLCDFGAATSTWLPTEHDMSQAGHKAYMSPERVTGTGEASVKTELFAMAVILWEMLRGERCFAADSEPKIMDEIVRFDIGHSSRRVPGLSPKLSDIVRKNLDRDPERRYKSAYQMLQRLAQAPEAQSAEQSRTELANMVAAAAGQRGSS